jgi:hypothetical protein
MIEFVSDVAADIFILNLKGRHPLNSVKPVSAGKDL